MCTKDYCPCPTNTDFSLWNEQDLNEMGRYYTNPLGVAKGYTILYKGIGAETSYPTFYDCYKHLIDMKNQYSNNPNYQKVEDLSDDLVSLNYS